MKPIPTWKTLNIWNLFPNSKSHRFTHLNLNALEAYVAGAINYIQSLVLDPAVAISRDCLYKLGNKYFLKSKSLCSNGEPIHRYIDNMDYYNIITGRTSTGNDGIIPAAVSSVTKINASGMVDALFGSTVKKCVKIDAPCHVVDSHNKYNSYFGTSPGVWITNKHYKDLIYNGKKINLLEGDPNDDSDEPSETTRISNLSSQMNKASTNLELFKNIKKSDINKLDIVNNPDNIENVYYILIIIILFFITYKIMTKK